MSFIEVQDFKLLEIDSLFTVVHNPHGIHFGTSFEFNSMHNLLIILVQPVIRLNLSQDSTCSALKTLREGSMNILFHCLGRLQGNLIMQDWS